MSCVPERVKFIISGIQYFHDCDTAAKERHNEEDQLEEAVIRRGHQFGFDNELDAMKLGEDVVDEDVGYSEEGLALVASQTPLREEITHAWWWRLQNVQESLRVSPQDGSWVKTTQRQLTPLEMICRSFCHGKPRCLDPKH